MNIAPPHHQPHRHPPAPGAEPAHEHGRGGLHFHPHSAAGARSDRRGSRRRLAVTLALVVGYMGAEIVGGWLTNSLALLADAGHMLSDAAALALSLFALWIGDRRPPSALRTYGYYRAEILAALANGAALVAIATLVAADAVARLRAPPAVHAGGMLAVAAGGLVVNAVSLALLHGSRDESLNLRGAWLHVWTDALGSVQVMVAAALVWWLGWRWADPVASLLIALLVVWSAWGLLREAVAVLMEAAPGHIDVEAVRAAILDVGAVAAVHDLHVWSIASGFECLSAHVVAEGEGQRDELLDELRAMLFARFGIDHITIQLEPPGFVDRCREC
ncbi:MAG TPA: cation diffusion facilitator family transporter [Thermoanaerobaculia bacterium]|jgi:cobalt-zinc-cadmium efflux system protein|nr:cation diffusion facilitator family transporter [Thermoanaerobaculia bacterium]